MKEGAGEGEGENRIIRDEWSGRFLCGCFILFFFKIEWMDASGLEETEEVEEREGRWRGDTRCILAGEYLPLRWRLKKVGDPRSPLFAAS